MMSPISRRVLTDFQVRKSRSQKEAFRAWLCKELEAEGADHIAQTPEELGDLILGL